MQDFGWRIWFARLVVGIVLTAMVAWGISFRVADYVVKANTQSMGETMRALQSSIDTLNNSIQAQTVATNALQEQLRELLVRSEQHAAAISTVEVKLDRVAAAVQDAGIAVRIGGEPGVGQSVPWELFIRAAEEGFPELDVNLLEGAFIEIPIKLPPADPPR